MTVNEISGKLGSWNIRLREETPKRLLDKLDYFGHIVILPGRTDPSFLSDNLLARARYVGVMRGKSSAGDITLSGAGMAFWLGDEDGKGDVFESPVNLTGATFSAAVTAVLPPSGAVTAGTITNPAGTYSGVHQWQTPREALDYIAGLFSTSINPVEWRVNGDGTLDAGPVSSLYVTNPKTILVKLSPGRDLRLRGLPGDMELGSDVEDYTTRVVVLAEGEGASIATGDADLPAVTLKDIHGNLVKITRAISSYETTAGNADAVAQLELNRFSNPRYSVRLDSSAFDIKGEITPGDAIYVFDPDNGFRDDANETYWNGEVINPMKLRCTELSWPVPEGWTVAFRATSGEWIDLSAYYTAESGSTSIVVGPPVRSLTGLVTQPIGSRPQADNSIPATPVFTSFSPGVYQSDLTSTTKAAIQATWATPLNIDGSTVLDGDHYEIRYRSSAIVGYAVPYDVLAGDVLELDDQFDRTASNGWGSPWSTLVAGSATTAGFSVDGDKALISSGGVSSAVWLTFQGNDIDTYQTVEFTFDKMPNGSVYIVRLLGRYVDGNNYYFLEIQFEGDNEVFLRLVKRVAGSETDLTDYQFWGYFTLGQTFGAALSIDGDTIKGALWDATLPQSDWMVSAVDTAFTSAGAGGVGNYIPGGWLAGAVNLTVSRYTYTALGVGSYYDYDELGSYDGLISGPALVSPEWNTVYAAWGQNAYTIMELTPGVTYELQIRAVDGAVPPNRSPWSASNFVTTLGDLIAPSTPAAGVVAASLIAIQVVHNLGKASGGVFNLEPDLDHLEVHVSTAGPNYSVSDATKVGQLMASQAMLGQGIPAVGIFQVEQTAAIYVRLVAVDRAGNKSGPSVASQVTAELIDDAHIGSLTASKITAGTISSNIVLASEIAVGTGGTIKVSQGRMEILDEFGYPLIELGKTSEGKYGMLMKTALGPKLRIGQINSPASTGHGMEAIDPDDNTKLVDINTIAFGMTGDRKNIVVNQGTTLADIPGGPSLAIRIGSSRRALVLFGCKISYNVGTGGTSQYGQITFKAVGPSAQTIVGVGYYGGYVSSSFSSMEGGTSVYMNPSLLSEAGTWTFSLQGSSGVGNITLSAFNLTVIPF